MHSTSSKAGMFAIAASAAALLGACTTAAEPQYAGAASTSDRQCFRPAQVNGFHALDDNTVHVFVGASDVYELEIAGTCPDIDWSTAIGIRSIGGGSWVCSGLDAELIVPSPIGLNRCPVLAGRQLTPDQAKALRAARS